MNGIFDPNTYIKTITLVGVGGTGASTARIVARILYDMQRARQHAPSLVLIDPDRVEEKNIGRQALFAPADIGQFKAECVARRLNAALGLDIGWIAEPLDPERHADRFGSSLVISCVDNHCSVSKWLLKPLAWRRGLSQSGCSLRLKVAAPTPSESQSHCPKRSRSVLCQFSRMTRRISSTGLSWSG